MSLDERLGLGFDTVHEERQPDSIKIRWHLGKDSISEIKQAILSDLLDIIGEEKHDKGFMRPAPEYGPGYSVGRPKCEALDGDECTCGADIANSTRDKIREKIKAYCE